MYMIARESRMKSKGMLAAMLLGGALTMSGASVAGVQEIVRDTQRTAESGGAMTLVWWMPQQFWEESLKANPAVPEAVRAQVLSVLADYTVIALLRAKPGATGLAEVQTKEELLKNVRVESNGKLIEPLAPEQIAPAAQLVLSQLKPAMAGMVGQVGQAMEFVVYPTKAADGKLQFDALQAGTLKVALFDANFSWRLPLGSLLPARVDKKTGEEFPGNYQFNPFTGDKLTVR
jgi:hypothetical protein